MRCTFDSPPGSLPKFSLVLFLVFAGSGVLRAQNVTLVGERNPFTATTIQYGDVWGLRPIAAYGPEGQAADRGVARVQRPVRRERELKRSIARVQRDDAEGQCGDLEASMKNHVHTRNQTDFSRPSRTKMR